ncbi:regulatory protein RecX [Actinoplanes sp. NPDC051861]|uniref:regulatory protein RecX n=1 Tax=Actinoplanes sp. NPDC051861 TaxID=3155170 RepID=UPI00342D48A4
MAGRRGARSGRGWDAIPPRTESDDPEGGGAGAQRRTTRRGRRPADTTDPWASPGDRGWADARGSAGGRDSAAERGELGSVGGRDSAGEAAGRERRPAKPQLSEPELAREICLRQLAVRPRTRAELAKVLARKEISEEVIAEVLDRYDEVGIIDDAAFARAWVTSRHQGRGLARRALANELRQRGVDAETAGEALESLDDESEAATARALVDRKLRTAHGTPEAVFRRLVAMLARKGYAAGIAIRAVKDALAARDAEAAEFAEGIDADALADHATDPPT